MKNHLQTAVAVVVLLAGTFTIRHFVASQGQANMPAGSRVMAFNGGGAPLSGGMKPMDDPTDPGDPSGGGLGAPVPPPGN